MELVKFPLPDFSKALFSGYKEWMRSCPAFTELEAQQGEFWGGTGSLLNSTFPLQALGYARAGKMLWVVTTGLLLPNQQGT